MGAVGEGFGEEGTWSHSAADRSGWQAEKDMLAAPQRGGNARAEMVREERAWQAWGPQEA